MEEWRGGWKDEQQTEKVSDGLLFPHFFSLSYSSEQEGKFRKDLHQSKDYILNSHILELEYKQK